MHRTQCNRKILHRLKKIEPHYMTLITFSTHFFTQDIGSLSRYLLLLEKLASWRLSWEFMCSLWNYIPLLSGKTTVVKSTFLMRLCSSDSGSNLNLKTLFLRREGNQRTRKKSSRQGREPRTSFHSWQAWIQTRAKSLGGASECSRHCAIIVLQN